MKLFSTVIISLLFSLTLNCQSISSTKHNLSISGPGTVKANSENQICIFCHTPHNSSPRKPLWNRNDPGASYILYNSSTLNASPGQPDGSSILCLSCHDGTIALGNVISRTADISFGGGITTMPSNRRNLGTDLSDDHPVSITYNSSLASADGELKTPSAISGQVHLENGKMQCISCHDPHMNIYSNFLVESRQYSALCLSCHDKTNWFNSRHKNSNKSWRGSGVDPWPNSSYTTVAQNACENCHTSHNAGGNVRLRNSDYEENNCLNCHNRNVASRNIEAEFNKTYSHNIYGYTNIHDANENGPINNMHVECVDCHNPHQVSGGNIFRGVKGVDANGNPISNIQEEYQLCYKCHSSSTGRPVSPTTRQFNENNVLVEFDLGNASYHPIEGSGKNPNVPSLLSGYSVSSIIKCTSCHSNNNTSPSSPNGVHGSIYEQILKFNYNRNTTVIESSSNYELCYECHDRNIIIASTGSNFQTNIHYKHIVEADSYGAGVFSSCNVCHDPHGVTNNTHLINFDLSIVSQYNGTLQFIDNGNFLGSCTLVCHSEIHDNRSY